MARDLIRIETEQPHVLLMCMNMSLLRNLWHKSGLNTRYSKPFPLYRVLGIDIPQRWYEVLPPGEIAAKAKGGDK